MTKFEDLQSKILKNAKFLHFQMPKKAFNSKFQISIENFNCLQPYLPGVPGHFPANQWYLLSANLVYPAEPSCAQWYPESSYQ